MRADQLCISDESNMELNNHKGPLVELEKKLYIPCLDLQTHKIDNPATVCGSAKCAKSVNGITNYTQVCHSPCSLTGITRDTINPAGMSSCAITHKDGTYGNPCNICGCAYQNHFHMYYRCETVEVERIDESINSQIKTKAEGENKIKEVIDDCKKTKESHEESSKAMFKASANFGGFLRKMLCSHSTIALKNI